MLVFPLLLESQVAVPPIRVDPEHVLNLEERHTPAPVNPSTTKQWTHSQNNSPACQASLPPLCSTHAPVESQLTALSLQAGVQSTRVGMAAAQTQEMEGTPASVLQGIMRVSAPPSTGWRACLVSGSTAALILWFH